MSEVASDISAVRFAQEQILNSYSEHYPRHLLLLLCEAVSFRASFTLQGILSLLPQTY